MGEVEGCCNAVNQIGETVMGEFLGMSVAVIVAAATGFVAGSIFGRAFFRMIWKKISDFVEQN
jgi:hypothetical protein